MSNPDINRLFPVFLKLENLSLVIVGGGYVGMEKLQAVLGNSPATKIKLVAITVSDAIKNFVKDYSNVSFIEKEYEESDLTGADLVIAALNDPEVSKKVTEDANKAKILINVADKPDLCDFYLSSIVQKGSLKIAISTNGKSPTVAKRLKEVISDMLPEELEEILTHIQEIRNNIKGDFEEKVKQLNELTKGLVSKK